VFQPSSLDLVVENIALFGGKRPQINLRALLAQNRIYPVQFCRPAIYRWAITIRDGWAKIPHPPSSGSE
jgi:hypothetical protein